MSEIEHVELVGGPLDGAECLATSFRSSWHSRARIILILSGMPQQTHLLDRDSPSYFYNHAKTYTRDPANPRRFVYQQEEK